MKRPLYVGVLAYGAVAMAGTMVRVAPLIGRDFPLLDGGMFAVMADELASGWLPATTSYNHLEVAFAYPPLGLALTAGLRTIGFEMREILLWVPAMFSIGTLIVFMLLARILMPTALGAVAASFAFAVTPRSYEWMVVGGGITRSVGFFLAVSCLIFVARFAAARGARDIVIAGVVFGLAGMAHLEGGIFAGVTAIALLWFRTMSGLLLFRGFGVMVAVGLLVSAPWWLAVLAQHGLDPFAAAALSRPNWHVLAAGQLLGLDLTDMPIVDPISIVATVGLVFAALRRWWLPVSLIALYFLFLPPTLKTYAMIPWAMLFGFATSSVIWPELTRRGRSFAVVGVVSLAMISSLWSGFPPAAPVAGMNAEDREAISWAAANLPSDAEVLVVTPAEWGIDYVAEWLPALTDLRSISTVQGTEWLGPAAHTKAITNHAALQRCHLRGAECVLAWIEASGANPDFIYVPKTPQRSYAGADCCAELRASLRAASWTRSVYDGNGAQVFEVGASSSLLLTRRTVPGSDAAWG